jgi:hypothetical protein
MSEEYSARAMKYSFWFNEYQKMLLLIHEGLSKDEIRKLSEDENLFSATTIQRGYEIVSAVYSRINSMPDSFHVLMETRDFETQKLMVLISIMNEDRLFFEFMYDVFREKMIIGDFILRDMDVRSFFRRKQESSDTVAGWTDGTISRLGRTYKAYLTDAGLSDHATGDRKLIKPYVDSNLKDVLIGEGMEPFLKALGWM